MSGLGPGIHANHRATMKRALRRRSGGRVKPGHDEKKHEREDNQLFLAGSGGSLEEGLKKIKEGLYDLVITDRAMPDMSGDLVAEAVKTLHPQMPVIMLTGFGELMKDSDEKPKGVDVVLSKPVTPNELRAAIAGVSGSRRVGRPASPGPTP